MKLDFKLAEVFKETSNGLDGVIEALTWPKPEPPPTPTNPKTVVTYQDGTIQEYLIEGELGQSSISNRTNAVNVEIGTAVSSIGDAAFYNCNKLESISFPNISNGITSIGEVAFNSCSNLTSITIPNSVTNISKQAFSHCGLLSIEIPSGVTSIEFGTFAACFNLSSIIIPNTVTSIGFDAFDSCDLRSIEIPSSVTSIDDNAFFYCTNLTSITCLATTAPTVQAGTFGNDSDEDGYTGRNAYESGNNVLKVPQGATGYDASYWADPLQDSTKCGFHIETI